MIYSAKQVRSAAPRETGKWLKRNLAPCLLQRAARTADAKPQQIPEPGLYPAASLPWRDPQVSGTGGTAAYYPDQRFIRCRIRAARVP